MGRKYKLEDVNIRPHNNATKYTTGSKWIMNSGEVITVIGQADVEKIVYAKGIGYKTYPYMVVEFDDGYRCVSSVSKINKKNIINKNTPTVFGVGYLGGDFDVATNGQHRKEYQIWCSMITRCYSKEFLERTPSYRGCSVVERWKCFKFFIKDIIYVQNYGKWKTNKISGKWALDKDIKVPGNKVYGPATCMFVTKSENSKEAFKGKNLTGLTYLGTRISDGYSEIFFDQTAFSKKHDLSPSSVSATILEKEGRKQHKGWLFQILGDGHE